MFTLLISYTIRGKFNFLVVLCNFFSSPLPQWLFKQVVRNKSNCLGFNQFENWTPGEQVMKCQTGHNMKISPGRTSRPTPDKLG